MSLQQLSLWNPTVRRVITPVFERYYADWVNPYAAYTPAVPGVFHMGGEMDISTIGFVPEYYTFGGGVWATQKSTDAQAYMSYASSIGDGANFRIRNSDGLGHYLAVMRFGGLKAEKYADISLAAGATYTPAAKGLFHVGTPYVLGRSYISPMYYVSTANAWYDSYSRDTYDQQIYGNQIGDGANFRLYNKTSSSYWVVIMRCY